MSTYVARYKVVIPTSSSQMRLHLRARGPAGEVHARHAGAAGAAGHRAHGVRRPEDHLRGFPGLCAGEGGY